MPFALGDVDGEEYFECPKKALCTREIVLDDLLIAWRYARNGCFPDPGTWLDQVHPFTQAIEVFEEVVAEMQAEAAAKDKDKTRP